MLTFPRVSLVSARGGIRRLAMENQAQNKVYLHYNHTDPCRYARWNARYIYIYIYIYIYFLNLISKISPLRMA
jgi:hypothetical protein